MTNAKKCYGLSISRSGENMSLSWKRRSDADAATAADGRYAAQRLHYYVDFGGTAENHVPAGEFKPGVNWTSAEGVDRGATSNVKRLTLSDWCPARPRAMRGWGFSVEATTKNFDGDGNVASPIRWFSFYVPHLPELTARWNGVDNVTEFSWSTPADANGHRPVADVQVQTALETPDDAASWTEVSSGSLSGSYSAPESMPDDAPHRRILRARARGLAGNSDWVHASHVYAIPKKPSLNTAGTGRTAQRDWVQWICDQNGGWNPVDRVLVQRAICTPQPNGWPADGDWSDEATVADVATQTRTPIEYSNGAIDDDEAVFVRVVAVHDNHEVASDAHAIAHGKVAAPSTPTVTWSGRTATVTWRHNSALPGAKTRVLYRTESDARATVIGEFDSSTESMTYTIPASASTGKVMFGAMGVCAGFFNSSEMWQSAPFDLPDTPTGFSVGQGREPGEALLEWNMPESTITDVQVAWSDSPSAWWSTGQPNTYNTGRRVGSWRISGLDLGTTYWCRVRFANGSVWGEWSELLSYTPRTSPDTPVVSVDSDFVKWGGYVGLSWTYSNADGTELASTVIQRLDSSLDTVTFAAGSGQSWQQPATMAAGAYSYRVKVVSATGEESPWSEWARVVVVGLPDPRTTSQKQRDASSEASTSVVNLPDVEIAAGAAVKRLTRLPLYESMDLATDPWWTEERTWFSLALVGDFETELPDGTWYRGSNGDVVYEQGPKANAMGKSWYPFALDDVPALYPQLMDGAVYQPTFHVVRTPNGDSRIVNQRDFDLDAFQVKWEHQAHAATAVAVTTGGSVPDYGATVSYTASGADYATDRHDIYRVTADGLQLLRRDATPGVAYFDPYAPLGKAGAAYRVATVTESGDFAWVEKACPLESSGIVIDFDGKRLVLPMNVETGDTWEKPFTATRHRGGSITGSWSPGASQTASWRADGVRIAGEEDVLLVRELARWTGECYVRAPHGVGYAANVDVMVNRAAGSSAVEVGLTVTRVDSDGFAWSWLGEWVR